MFSFFEYLPVELLLKITDKFTLSEHKNLAQVNKFFNQFIETTTEICIKQLYHAVKQNNASEVKRILSKGIKFTNKSGEKMLLSSVKDLDSDDRIPILLIKHGVDVNAIDSDGNTALHHAAKRGKVTIAKILIKYGADRSTMNDNSEQPWNLAEKNDFRCLVMAIQFPQEKDYWTLALNSEKDQRERIATRARQLASLN